MQKPKVSVILPNYNHASFLERRLKSIYNQTYENIEVILLDDNSSDHSVEILKSYEFHSKTSCLLVNSINSGSPFKQWDKGLRYAKGKYIWIAESDDWAEETFLEKLIPLVEKKDVGIAFCNSHWVDAEDQIRKSLSIHTSSFKSKGKEEIVKNMIYRNTIQNVSSVLFNSSLLKSSKCKYTECKACGDWLLYVDLLLKSDVVFCEECLNYFRWYSNNTSQNAIREGIWVKEGIEVLSLIGDRVKLRKKKLLYVSWIWYKKIFSFYKKTSNIKEFFNLLRTIFIFQLKQF